jgi:dihydropteroate synthase
MIYARPLVQIGPARPDGALPLAGGWGWFTHVEVLERGAPGRVVPAGEVPEAELARLIAPRAGIAGLSMDRPQIMGILNTTPDSFSDGGDHAEAGAALAGAEAMVRAGAALLDIGGESTRPGAQEVETEEEIRRTAPVIRALSGQHGMPPLSIDTRKSAVAEAALDAGAALVNDVSGFLFDPALAPLCAARGVPVCVMHSIGTPETMQAQARYSDVVLDVFDHLAARIDALEALGIPRGQIIADPGIGFGKTQEHNLALLQRLSLFHALGVPLLLGVSRKRFIGTIGGAEAPKARMPGSVAVALAGLEQGVQVLRVHDVPETVQALALWAAARGVALS